MQYLLDANIISNVLRYPDAAAARRYQAHMEDCFTSIIVASELRYGITKHPERTGSRDATKILEQIFIAPFESPADEHYGGIRAQLERVGIPIGANDMLIAAHALALDCTLVSANEREFRRVPGLKLENWVA